MELRQSEKVSMEIFKLCGSLAWIQNWYRDGGYYIADRTFQLAELKLLVDSVQACKFISERKTRSLIHKLESLTSQYQAKSLHRQVYVQNRIKTMNESVYYLLCAYSSVPSFMVGYSVQGRRYGFCRQIMYGWHFRKWLEGQRRLGDLLLEWYIVERCAIERMRCYG